CAPCVRRRGPPDGRLPPLRRPLLRRPGRRPRWSSCPTRRLSPLWTDSGSPRYRYRPDRPPWTPRWTCCCASSPRRRRRSAGPTWPRASASSTSPSAPDIPPRSRRLLHESGSDLQQTSWSTGWGSADAAGLGGAAVEDKGLAGDPARLVGEQERDRGADILGHAEPTDRVAPGDLLLAPLVEGLGELGLHHRRGDRVHPDLRSELDGELLGQVDQRGLAQPVHADVGRG